MLLEHSEDWERILAVLAWFCEHPRPAIYVRQIDVPDVDTKFIEGRRALFTELLDLVLPAEAVDGTSVRTSKLGTAFSRSRRWFDSDFSSRATGSPACRMYRSRPWSSRI